MDIIHKRFPVEEISIDELREKVDDEDDSTFFEYKLGLYCEMDTDSIGIKTDLSRLFKKGVFSASEKRSIVKKLADLQLNTAERKAFQRALVKLRNFYLN
jgi:hypothetical protein